MKMCSLRAIISLNRLESSTPITAKWCLRKAVPGNCPRSSQFGKINFRILKHAEFDERNMTATYLEHITAEIWTRELQCVAMAYTHFQDATRISDC